MSSILTAKIYNAIFEVGDFIYFDDSVLPHRYKLAKENKCDFIVIDRKSDHLIVSRNASLELSNNSNYRKYDNVIGEVYLGSNGKITHEVTNTKIGHINGAMFYVDISNSSTSPGPLGATSTQIEYVSSGPIIDIPVYFSAEQVSQSLTADLVNGHIVNSNSKLKKAFLVLNDAGIKGDILSLPAKFIVSIQTQLGELFSLRFNINSTQVGKFYPAECRIYSEILDLNVPVNKGDTVFLKFENDTAVYGDTSTITYYGTAKILLELEEV